jgi:hypothetical protein
MVPQFADEPVHTGQGRARVQIDPEVAQWCEATYARGRALDVPLPLPMDHPDTAALLRQIRLYATRQHKSIEQQLVERGGDRFYRFRMRDRRRYNVPGES